MSRNRNQIIDIVVSNIHSKLVYVRMAQRLERKDYQVEIMCTDGDPGYGYTSWLSGMLL